MNADLLLYWMSRLGTSSWRKFAEAVEELAQNEDQDELKRRLPGRLSDLAHADFSRTTNKWKVRPPILAGLLGQENTALLCGARSEPLLASLEQAAKDIGIEVLTQPQQDLPSRVSITASSDYLGRLETATGITFAPCYALQLLANVPPIAQKLQNAQPEKGIVNWQVNTFDLTSLQWVWFSEKLTKPDSLPKLAAIELISKYETKYCVTDGHAMPRKIPKREALYAAASLRHRPLLQYEASTQRLSAPIAAPMPEVCARVACLCSGSPPHVEDGRLFYENVPLTVAATLAVLLGQPHPGLLLQ